jgi:hypothetical protein
MPQGEGVTVSHVFPEIDPLLYKNEPGVQSKAKGIPARGYAHDRRSGPIKFPDEHILDIRKRHEVLGQSYRTIEKAYPQYSRDYIYSVLSYETRSKLFVKP